MEQVPFFSVIIPTYNRPERLAVCLEALVKMEYPSDRLEIIIVDDGSQISLEPVITPWQNQRNIILLKQPNQGPATARNTGAASAKGQFLAFTDDDCLPDSNWLQALGEHFSIDNNSLIGGQTINALPDNLYSKASQNLVDYLYSIYNLNPENARFFTSNNFALSKAKFQEIGGFDTTFPLAAGEDREFCDRWLAHGYPMLYAPDAQVYHAHHLTLKTFYLQQFNYGRGAFHFHKISQQTEKTPLSFYLNLLTYPLSQKSDWQANAKGDRLKLALLFLLSQIAITTGLAWESTHQPQS